MLKPLAVVEPEKRLVPPQVWFLLVLLPVTLWLFGPGLSRMFRDPLVLDWVAETRAGRAGGGETAELAYEGTWVPAPGGLSHQPAAPDERAAIELEVPPGPWDAGKLTLYAAPESVWTIRVTRETVEDGAIRLESRNYTAVQTDRTVVMDEGDFPDPAFGESGLRIRLLPVEPGRAAGGEFALFRGADVRISATRVNAVLSLPDLVGIGVLAFVAAVVGRAFFGWSRKRAIPLGLGAGMLAAAALIWKPNESQGVAGLVAGLCAAGAIQSAMMARGIGVRRRRMLELSREEWNRAAFAFSVGLVALFALQSRWQAFLEARRTPLSPDEAGFLMMALRGGPLYDTWQEFAPWVREPLFPWLLRLWLWVTPDSAASAHLLAMLLSVAAVAAVALVGARLFGGFVGIAAGLVLATSPEWAAEGTRVLRLNLSVLLLMGLVAVRREAGTRPWWRSGLGGLLAGMLVLTRISSLAFVVPVLAWEAWRRKWQPAEMILAGCLVAVPLLPHLGFNYRHQDSGDYFYSSTVHTRFYSNRDFAGTEGFPSREEVAADPYAGEPMSAGTYFLRHHGLVATAVGHVKGYWRLFVWGTLRERLARGHEWLLLPGLVGAWALWRRRDLWWIAGWFVLAMLPYAFIATRGAAWRLGGEAQVLSLWVWALGFQAGAMWVAVQIRVWRARRRGSEPTG
jgi:hypothetical protein